MEVIYTARVIKMSDISRQNAVDILGKNNPELLRHILFDILEEEVLENAVPDVIKQEQYCQIGKMLAHLSSLHNSDNDRIIWQMDNPYAKKDFHVISLCLGEDIDFHQEELLTLFEIMQLINKASCLVNVYSKFDEVHIRICFENIYQTCQKSD